VLTLNQIVSQITNLASAHNQIAESGVGDFAEWQAKERNYPILWVFHESTSVNQMEIAFSIRLICADRVIVGEEGDNTEGHEQEVISDTLLVLLDFLAYFQQNHSQPYNVVTSATIDPFTERLNDRLAGNSVTIQIRQPFDWNKCQIPQTGASIPPSVDGLTLYNFCDAAVSARLTDEQIACIQSAFPTPCPDATYTLEDTDGNTLSTGSIPSGGSEDIVAPDGTVLRDGQPFGSVLSGGTIDVPSDCPPCSDGNIELNGTPVATVPSGGTTDIPVIQDGSPAGSWNGTQWVIPSCPAPSPPRNTAMAIKTGQTVSYGTGSDGDVQAGRGVDFFTLEENNPFGNTNRFTDINGGQVFSSGNIALDWLTYSESTGQLLWILLDKTAVRNWGDCLAEAVARTDYGYNDWRLLNVNEAGNLMYWEVGQNNAFDYTPMSVANIGSGSWTGTTYPRDATRAAIITATTFSITGSQTKSTSQRGAICRTGNISELTIP
jgi:hypothetical protein